MQLNRTKKIFIFLLLFLIVSCETQKQKSIKDSSLEKIIKKGKIVALTGYNAYSYFIYKGKTMGYEYELLQRLGKQLGVKVEIKVVKSIDEMIEKLNSGEGDLIASNLTVTNNRKQLLDFTTYLNRTKQVLVQRLPQDWRKMTLDGIDEALIRDPIDLENKTVYVRRSSVYGNRLKNLSNEIGSEIKIIEADDSLSIEDLIKQVADGKIDYTVSDENIADLNKAYFDNIDTGTPISFTQKISWAVRKGNSELLNKLNEWITEFKKTKDFHVIYDRYYKQKRYYKYRRGSQYFLTKDGKISPYDLLIKKYAKQFGYDWRLLASIIFAESGFDPKAKSWAGAVGLMQLLPETAKSYGNFNLTDPEENIKVGVKYLSWLDKYWKQKILDNSERIKFILSSYNIGFGHVEDAQRLAEKYGANEKVWKNNVEKYLLKKSNPKFYNDEVVKNGYCNCKETIRYVNDVLQKYKEYQQFIN
ncbi:MAG: transporter substrate-binding domain-containing protein [Melioribacteraceae bacterium]